MSRKLPKEHRVAAPANWIHFRASTQLTEALDALAVAQGVTRSELARTILETTLKTGSLAEIGARQGLFHFHAALRRAVSHATPEVAKIIEKHLNEQLDGLEETGQGAVAAVRIEQRREKVERRVQQEHLNRRRVVEPGTMADDDAEEEEELDALPPGFGPG